MSAAEGEVFVREERSLSPSGVLEREEARVTMARQEFLKEYRAIQTKNRLLVKQDDVLKEEYLLVIRENQELESTCNKLVAAEHEMTERLKDTERRCRNLDLLVDYLEPAIIKEKELVSELRAELAQVPTGPPDLLEIRQLQAQLTDLQTRYDTLCNTHSEAEQRRKVDIQKWIELKTRLESDNGKLRVALRREKAKNTISGAGENSGTGEHPMQQSNEGERKQHSQSKSDKGNAVDRREGRTPLRTVGTPVTNVRHEQKLSQTKQGYGRDDVNQRQILDQNAIQETPLKPAQHTLLRETVPRGRHTPTKQLGMDKQHDGAGYIVPALEFGSSSEKERTLTEHVLDARANARALEQPHQNLGLPVATLADVHDTEGSATEEDEEMPLVRKAVPGYVGSTGHRSVLHVKMEDIEGQGSPGVAKSDNSHSLLSKTTNATKTLASTSRNAPKIAANIVSDNRNTGVSSNRLGQTSSTRLDRTPSGLKWLGGDKSKPSRRDSFEDEVGSSTRAKLKEEVTATLPRSINSRQLRTATRVDSSGGSMLRDRQLQIGDAQDTPTRMPGTTVKRKREALTHTPSVTPKINGTAFRSDKKPRLAASHTRTMELQNDEIYVVNPKVNGGKSYTFNSVERNKERRQCMHGEACHECDAWYDLTSDIQHVPAIRFGATPSPQSLIEEDQEELAQAQRQKLMNSVSRHKVEHEKNPTPPGYWEPGMPSTQAVERQNMEADAMLEAKRERQRREAKKEDGKWIVYNRNPESSIRSSRKS